MLSQQTKELPLDIIEELRSYYFLSCIKAIIIDPADTKLIDKIRDSNNHYAYNQLESLLNKAIAEKELHPKETSNVRSLLCLPDSSYVAKNPSNYGMTLEDIDSHLSSEDFIKDEKRLYGLLMHYFSQNFNEVSKRKFEEDITNYKEEKQPEFFRGLGHIKKYNTALSKYRSVAHFMLARRWVTEAVFEAEGSFKSGLEKLLKLACYFKERLLKLSNKHSQPNNLFLPEDFMQIPFEVGYVLSENDRECFDKMTKNAISKLFKPN